MKKKSNLCGYAIACLLLLCCWQPIYAQQQKISGKVKDKTSGRPLSGVSVKALNATRTVVTDGEGVFSLAVDSANVTIEFSYVGYDALQLPASNNMTAEMTAANKQLDEVVVIGYGTVKRKDLTGAVTTVKAADIVRTPTHNAVEAIQGRVPGVDITRSSGKAGSNSNIQIRGTRSFSGTNTPLYVIDGVQGANIDDLNPNDIESMDVLRDASSTAIYGSAGANGVIIVTTKKGKEGRAQVAYNGYYGINGLTPFPKGRTGADYIQLRREAWRTTGEWASPADDAKLFSGQEWSAVQAGQWVDWVDLLMRNGVQQSHNVSVAGGNDKTKAFLSAGYFNEKGRLLNDVMKRYTVRLNLDQKVNNWMKAGIQSQITIYDNNTRPDQLFKATGLTPLGVPYDAAGNINLRPISGAPNQINPLADNRGRNIYTDNAYTTNVLINPYLEINIMKGLTFRSVFGANLSNIRNGVYRDSSSYYHLDRSEKFADASIKSTAARQLTWDNIITWNKNFGDHSLTVTGVASMVHGVTDYVQANGQGATLVSFQQFYNLSAADAANQRVFSGYTKTDSRAYAARVNYGYKGKYLLTVTNRYDGNAKLSGKKWDNFPSVAAGWSLSQESFMEPLTSVFNQVKLRAGYGITGNSGIDAYGTQSLVIRSNNMSFGEVAAPYYLFSSTIGNPNLGWEKTATANLGIDFAFLKNRITASVDVYRARTYDVLILRRLPTFTGVGSASTPAQVYQNAGETVNKGLEVIINSQNIKGRDFQWNSTLSFSTNKERITKLIDGRDIIPSTGWETNSYLIGRPMKSFYSYRKLGIWQTGEKDAAAGYSFAGKAFQPGDIKLQDVTGNNIINDSDRTYLGSVVPKWSLGFQNTFSYKGFDLGIYMIVRWGQMINAEFMGRYNPDGAGNGLAFMDYWTPENPSNDFPRASKSPLNSYAGYQSLSFVDGSFMKIKNVTFGYTFPKNVTEKMRLGNLRVYATGSNLFTFTKSHLLRNYDPERGGATDDPLTRQFVFGLNVGF
ncbi:TonB-linked SusC/RagA family outer membrane protein [Filimonas zeae]|uniref:SusC/RagA family TonB-linked outer membrane protein n=1 Tax=Filimonas zeae TaxID=1737353 RepID=UPI00166DF775|nr:TonB-dependent receptor [Filimonas zeae]MDR6337840.1 TonB-linked SusC/RagA family outer membrane protein [Filimonas zeae]